MLERQSVLQLVNIRERTALNTSYQASESNSNIDYIYNIGIITPYFSALLYNTKSNEALVIT